jgi:cytochrome b involved in lipid metabolism
VDGKVYDVTAGRRFYGPEGSYHFFAGKDATRSFVSGCFKDDCPQDLNNLSENEKKSLEEWEQFYAEHQEYFFVGYISD